MYNPDGTKIVFLQRIKTEEKWLSSLWTVNSDGTNLECHIPYENWISHYDWLDNETILVTTDYFGGKMYIQFTVGENDFKPVDKRDLLGDGHCSISPDGEWILSDSYPFKRTKPAELFLYNIKLRKKIMVGEFQHERKY